MDMMDGPTDTLMDMTDTLMDMTDTLMDMMDGNMQVNRAHKSRRTLQNEVRLKVLPEQLTLFVSTSVAFKKCIIQ